MLFTYSSKDEIMLVKFYVCTRSAGGTLIRGVDGGDKKVKGFCKQYEEIEKKMEKKNKGS